MNTAEIATEKPASRWEDYIDVFFSPSELYARRASSSVKPVMFTVMIVSAILYYAFLPVNQMVMRAAMVQSAAQRGIDPAQVEASAGGMVKFMSVGGGLIVPITVFLTIMVTAALLYGVGRLLEVKGSWHQALVVASYASIIYVVAMLAGSIAGIIAGEGLNPLRDMSFGLMRFFDAQSLPATLPPLLRRTEIFYMWQAVLWAIGLRVVMKASKSQAAIVAVATWLLFALPGIIGAVLGLGGKAAGIE